MQSLHAWLIARRSAVVGVLTTVGALLTALAPIIANADLTTTLGIASAVVGVIGAVSTALAQHPAGAAALGASRPGRRRRASPVLTVAALTVAAIMLLAAGRHHGLAPAPHRTARAMAACQQAADGHGQMGACAPGPRGLQAPPPPAGVRIVDLSNNNPATCAQIVAMRRHGVRGLYVKVNQGTGFIDRTAAGMVRCARRAGLATGGYDFVAAYSAAEARVFVARLRAVGMTRTAHGWLPPVLDVEYAAASRGGVTAMVQTVRAAFGRVMIYTGGWYWTPHLGAWWPGVRAWLAGYPTAPRFPGLRAGLYRAHQYTDRGFNGAYISDLSVWCAPAGCPAGGSARSFAHLAHLATGRSNGRRRAELGRLYRYRRRLRTVLRREGCIHLHPRTRRCRVWHAHLATARARIRVLHHHGA